MFAAEASLPADGPVSRRLSPPPDAVDVDRRELADHNRAPRLADNRARNVLLAVAGAVMAFAWLALWLLGHSPYGRFLEHGETTGGPLGLGMFLLGWSLMIVAMMVPSAIPLLRAFSRTAHGRPDHGRLLMTVTAGYFAAWIAFGLAVRMGDSLVHATVARLSWLDSKPQLVAAAVLVLAGMHQLSGLKDRCLSKCRTPVGFLYRYWTGKHPSTDAFRVGAQYGVSCIGCCLGLMLVMFALGLGSLGWMLVVGSVMALEKNTGWGAALSPPMAILLFTLGVASTLQTWG